MPDHDRRSFTGKLRHFRIQKRQKAPTGQTRATELADRFSGQSFAQLSSPQKAEQKLIMALSGFNL
jgi:hypothetical protein